MEWLGWVLAAVAIAAAVRLWRQLAAERAHGSEVLYGKLDAENRIDALLAEQAATADTGNVFIPVADRLDAAVTSTRTQLERAAADFGDYREHVKRFDAAVQYCLQPVELIFGADKASLDQLVHHVEAARRKLFETRSLLEKHPLHGAAGALDGALGEVCELAVYADGLRVGTLAAAPDAPADAEVMAPPQAAAVTAMR